MKTGDMIIRSKVLGHKVVSMDTDGDNYYTSFLLDSGVRVEPAITEDVDGPKVHLKVVIKHATQKAGQTPGGGGEDTGASGGDQEDSESS